MMLHKRIIFVACQEVIIAKHGQWVEIIPEVYFMSIFVLFTKISVIFLVGSSARAKWPTLPKLIYNSLYGNGCRQCLPLSVVQLKGKHCRKPHCRNGVKDMFGLGALPWKLDNPNCHSKMLHH